jgi:hypothetical protein
MKIGAERDKDTLDIARLLRRLNITSAANAVDRAPEGAASQVSGHCVPGPFQYQRQLFEV